MQVSMDEMRRAMAALNPLSRSSRSWSEADCHKCLAQVGFSERQSRSVLLSLCHWRRLRLIKKGDDRLEFAVESTAASS